MAKEKISNEKLFKENKFDELYLNVIDLMRYKGNLYKKVDSEEKESIYNLSFTEAIKRYDLSKEVKFSTFLCLILLGNLNKYVTRDREYRNSHLRLSLDTPSDENENSTLLSCIEDTHCVNPEENAICQDILKKIDVLLDKRTAECFKLFLNGNNQTEIGVKIGVSQVQVSRIIKKARTILKNYCNGTMPPKEESVKKDIDNNDNKIAKDTAKKRKSNRRFDVNKPKERSSKNKMATKKDQCFALFEENYHTSEIVKALAIPKNTVITYRQMWLNSKKSITSNIQITRDSEKQKEKDQDTSFEKLFNDVFDEKQNNIGSNKKDIVDTKDVAPKINQAKTVLTSKEETIPDKQNTEEIPASTKETIEDGKRAKIVLVEENCIKTNAPLLELIYENKVYKGRFGTYKIINKTKIELSLENPFAALTAEEFDIFSKEMNELKQNVGQ